MDYSEYETIRKIQGLKDSDVARATNIPKSTFSDWKNGRSCPKNEKLIKIAKFLNIPLEQALGSDKIEFDHNKPAEGLRADSLFSGIKGLKISEDYYLEDDAKEMAQFLFSNPEYRALFDASRKVKPEDLQRALKAIGIFTEE